MIKNVNKSKYKNTMDPPVYDEDNETISEYIVRVETYNLQFRKIKYDAILDFLNVWLEPLNIKIKYLTDFKNLSEKRLTQNKKYNRDVLRDNIKQLQKILCVKSFIESDTDSDDIGDQCIISFTGKLLKVISYSIISFTDKDKGKLWSIKNKTPSIKRMY